MSVSTKTRIGYFFFCLVPLCIVGLLQLLLSIPAVAIAGIWNILQHGAAILLLVVFDHWGAGHLCWSVFVPVWGGDARDL